MFAYQHAAIEPDLIAIAKSLAAGMPLSAVIGKAAIMDAPLAGGLGVFEAEALGARDAAVMKKDAATRCGWGNQRQRSPSLTLPARSRTYTAR